jgi:steroid 5-alpha reductase family enzyme
MFYLLTKVSGIPMTEEQLISSKGEAYKKISI